MPVYAVQYAIDDVPVNSRIDWNPQSFAQPVDKRFEGFPGQSEQYVIVDAPKPPDLRMTGYILADTFDALMTLIESYSDMEADGQEHKVTVKDREYTAMNLETFRTVGDYHPRDGQLAFRVVFNWRRLRKEVTVG